MCLLIFGFTWLSECSCGGREVPISPSKQDPYSAYDPEMYAPGPAMSEVAEAGSIAEAISEIQSGYSQMFDVTEIEVGQPLEFVKPMSDWICPDPTSTIPQLDTSSAFFKNDQFMQNMLYS